MSPIEFAWREAWKPLERLTLPEFAQRYVKVGAEKADFDMGMFSWNEEPMEVMTDYSVPMQASIIAAQLGKGRSAEAAVPYFVVTDPGDITWYGMTNDKAEEYAEERLMPTLRNCEPVLPYLPSDRHKLRKQAIVMAHMVMEVLGANETNTQSRTRRIIFCDEAWHWLPGMLASAISRTSAPHLRGRRKIIITSTGGDEDGDLERYWDTSDQRGWHVRCPKCKYAHPLALSRNHCRRVPAHILVFSLKWDDNEITRPGGTWHMEEVKKTVRMLCPSCAHEFAETPEIIRSFRSIKYGGTGHYVKMNPLASKERAGFWVPRMAAGEWGTLVERFLKVNEERKMGFEDNFREFLIKDLAERWSVGGADIAEANPSGDYDMTEPPEAFQWDKEYCRFLTVDRQALSPQFWYVVRAWGQNGESRLVECGHCETKQEVEDIAERHGLIGTKSMQVGVDAGWESDDTWAWCAANHWYAFRGDEATGYRHQRTGKKSVIKFFSPKIPRRVGVGGSQRLAVSCIEFMWSNPSIKSFLSRLKAGTGLYWGIARNVGAFYLPHLDSEYKKAEIKGGKTTYRFVQRGKRPNHLWDCECMQLVSAFMANLIPIGLTVAEEEEKIEIELVT